MKRIYTFLFLLLFMHCQFTIAQQTGKFGDQGDGTFRNPVIAADFSDPDPVRVGDDYYMVSSTFESYPGVSVLHSKDLVNWKIVGAALTDLVAADSAYSVKRMERYNGGAYAPTITYHNNTFYIYVNLYTDGFYVATAINAKGPWKSRYIRDKNGKPLKVTRWSDPCPFWDEDGKAYLVSSRPGRDYWYSYIFQMSEDGTQLLDADSTHMAQGNILYQFPDGGTVISPYHSSEGNRIFKRNGYYYLQHIEFTNQGQGEGTYIFRSKNLYGTLPDGSPGKPGVSGKYDVHVVEKVTSRDNLRLPGQGGYVSTPERQWYWMGQFTKDGAEGRPPCLLPVTWIDDWPVIGSQINNMEGQMAWQLPKPIDGYPTSLPHGSDDFDNKQLNLRWMWNHQPRNNRWSLNERPGYLRLHAFPTVDKGGFFKAGNTINQRYMRSDTVVVTVKIDIDNMADGQNTGLAHFNGGKFYASIGLVMHGKNNKRLKYESNGKTVDGNRLESGQKTIYLRTCVGFDNMASFQYSLDGFNFTTLGNHYKLTPANFRGDMIGIYTYNDNADAGFIDIDWFKYDVSNN